MFFDPSLVKRLVLAAVSAVVLTLTVNVGYGLACFSRQGLSLPQVLREMRTGAPYFILGLFLAAVGAILGTRLAAGKAPRWAGLAAGAGLVLVVIVVSWVQGRLDFWLPPNALMAVTGGWLGSWLGGRL